MIRLHRARPVAATGLFLWPGRTQPPPPPRRANAAITAPARPLRRCRHHSARTTAAPKLPSQRPYDRCAKAAIIAPARPERLPAVQCVHRCAKAAITAPARPLHQCRHHRARAATAPFRRGPGSPRPGPTPAGPDPAGAGTSAVWPRRPADGAGPCFCPGCCAPARL